MNDQFFNQQFAWFTGVVEDRNDPEKMNRVRVRVFGLHSEAKTDIPTADLPWASVLLPTTSAGTSGIGETPHFLVEGTWVVGFFRDGISAQDPVILGTLASMSGQKGNSTKGFTDPNGTYPIDRYVGASDVNELARGGDHPSIATRNTTSTGVTTADGFSWDEPGTTRASEYSKNHVYETESGHIREYDDTDGAERIYEQHKSGTFYEIDADGNKVTRVVGDGYEVIAGNNNVYVKGKVNLTIDSDCNTYVKGNWNIKVDGNISTTVGGNYTETVSGNQTTKVTGNIDIDGARIDLN